MKAEEKRMYHVSLLRIIFESTRWDKNLTIQFVKQILSKTMLNVTSESTLKLKLLRSQRILHRATGSIGDNTCTACENLTTNLLMENKYRVWVGKRQVETRFRGMDDRSIKTIVQARACAPLTSWIYTANGMTEVAGTPRVEDTTGGSRSTRLDHADALNVVVSTRNSTCTSSRWINDHLTLKPNRSGN